MILLLALLSPTGVHGKSNTLTAGNSLDLAERFYSNKDYFNAISEAKRFIFFNQEDIRTLQAKNLIEKSEKAIKVSSKNSRMKNSNTKKGKGAMTLALVGFYQENLRGFKRSTCPSYPSGSEYSILAIKKHGALLGTAITVDRFFREMTTIGTPPYIMINRRRLHYDPLEENDYWLFSGRDKK